MSDQEDALEVKAREICKHYLSGSWDQVPIDKLEFRKLGSIQNQLFLVSLPESERSLETEEPHQVLVRFHKNNYGGTDDNEFKLNSNSADAVIFYILSRAGLGPNVIGVFDGGRIEEYIDSHTLNNEELENYDMMKSLARKVAKMHHLEAPLPKNKYRSVIMDERSMKKFLSLNMEDAYTTTREVFKPEDMPSIEAILAFPVIQESDFVRNILKKITSKIVFCHNDLTPANILMKNKGSGNFDEDLVIIDPEWASYDYRGIEFGQLFYQRSYNYANLIEEPLTGLDYPDEKLRRHFVREYIDSLKSYQKLDPNLDTEDHILLESDVYSLDICLGMIKMFITFYCESHLNPDISRSFHNSDFVYSHLNNYDRLKKNILEKYADILI